MTAKGFERKEDEPKCFKKGLIYLIGNMSSFGASETELNIREAILEKEGYLVYNPMKIIPYNSSERLRNRILIAKMMECKKVYVMLGYAKTPISNLLLDIAISLNYDITNEEEDESIKA